MVPPKESIDAWQAIALKSSCASLGLVGRSVAHDDVWDRECYGRVGEMESVDPRMAGRWLGLDVGRGEGDGAEGDLIWASPRFAGPGSTLLLLARGLAVGNPLRSLTRPSGRRWWDADRLRAVVDRACRRIGKGVG